VPLSVAGVVPLSVLGVVPLSVAGVVPPSVSLVTSEGVDPPQPTAVAAANARAVARTLRLIMGGA
jgi:hypothetical protein